MIDPVTLCVYLQLGAKIIKIGTGVFGDIRAALRNTPTFQADETALAEIDAEYERRIAQARREAGLSS